MTSIKFHLRPMDKAAAESRFFVRVIHRRAYRDIRLDYGVPPWEWDAENQRILALSVADGRNDPQHPGNRAPGIEGNRGFDGWSDSERLSLIAARIQSDRLRLDSIIERLARKGEFTVDKIVKCWRQGSAAESLGEFTMKLSEELLRQRRVRTARAYRSAVASLGKFTGGDIRICEINAELIRGYENYLTGRGLLPNTISFYMRNLRTIYNRAVGMEIIVRQRVNPFAQVFTGIHQTRRRSLDREELLSLARLEKRLAEEVSRLENDSRDNMSAAENAQKHRYVPKKPCSKTEGRSETVRLYESLLYFMFTYHSRGMSFVDLAHLKKSDINGGIIRYKRRKTGSYLEVKITPPMRKIIEHFRRRVKDSAYVFPLAGPGGLHYDTVLGYQNKRLKTIATMAGIRKTLSCHVARHTWATMAKRLGFPIALISEGLGHRDTKVTSIYLDSFERSAMDKLSTRLSGMIRTA